MQQAVTASEEIRSSLEAELRTLRDHVQRQQLEATAHLHRQATHNSGKWYLVPLSDNVDLYKLELYSGLFGLVMYFKYYFFCM